MNARPLLLIEFPKSTTEEQFNRNLKALRPLSSNYHAIHYTNPDATLLSVKVFTPNMALSTKDLRGLHSFLKSNLNVSELNSEILTNEIIKFDFNKEYQDQLNSLLNVVFDIVLSIKNVANFNEKSTTEIKDWVLQQLANAGFASKLDAHTNTYVLS